MLLKDAPPSSQPFSFRTFLPLILFFCLIIGVTCYIASMRKKGEVDPPGAFFMPEVRLTLSGNEPSLTAAGTALEDQDLLLPAVPNAEQSYLLANRAMENGNHEAAEELLRNALLFNPKEIKLYALLSRNLFLQKKLPEAESVLRRLLYFQPANRITCRNLAMVLGQQKKYSEAVPVLLQILRHLPETDKRERGEIHLQLALMYAGNEQRENVLDSLRMAGRLLEGRQILDAAGDPLFDFLRGDPEFYMIFQELSERRKKE